MTFTIRQAALWAALSFAVVVILALLFAGTWFTLIGLSLALNLYLSWHHIGHDKMLRALGLHPPVSSRNP